MEGLLIETGLDYKGTVWEIHIEEDEASVWTRDTKLVENRNIVIDKQYNVINVGNTYILKAQTAKQSGVHDTRWLGGDDAELRFKYNNLEITIESKYIIKEWETSNVAEAVDTLELTPDEIKIDIIGKDEYKIGPVPDTLRAKMKLLGKIQ